MSGRSEREPSKKRPDHNNERGNHTVQAVSKEAKGFRYNEWTTCAPLAAKERAQEKSGHLGQ